MLRLLVDKSTDIRCAGKIYKKSELNEKNLEKLKETLRILKPLQHPNVLKLTGLIED